MERLGGFREFEQEIGLLWATAAGIITFLRNCLVERGGPHRTTAAWAKHRLLRLDRSFARAFAGQKSPVNC